MPQQPPPLSAFEEWMVKSNLNTIQKGTPASEIVAKLRANGYLRVATAVEKATEQKEGHPHGS